MFQNYKYYVSHPYCIIQLLSLSLAICLCLYKNKFDRRPGPELDHRGEGPVFQFRTKQSHPDESINSLIPHLEWLKSSGELDLLDTVAEEKRSRNINATPMQSACIYFLSTAIHNSHSPWKKIVGEQILIDLQLLLGCTWWIHSLYTNHKFGFSGTLHLLSSVPIFFLLRHGIQLLLQLSTDNRTINEGINGNQISNDGMPTVTVIFY